MVKRILRLIWRHIGNQLWFLVPGLILFLAGLISGVAYKKALGIDIFCSFLFIIGIVLIAVAVNRKGRGEVERPAAVVEEPPPPEEKPAAKKGRGARRRKKAATETVSWDI